MIGLESFYGVLNTSLKGKLTEDRLYHLLVKSPREILKMNIPSIQEKEVANFTLYHPKKEWTLEKSDLKSLSANTPFLGKKLIGKVLMTGNNGQVNKSV